MHLEDAGDGLPVLALHGLGGGAWFFSGFAARVASNFRIIAVDLPGTGRSVVSAPGVRRSALGFEPAETSDTSHPGRSTAQLPNADCRTPSGDSALFSLDSWVADLHDLIAEQIREPVVLLGHSMGTILALRMWQAFPEKIRALICVGGLPEPTAVIRLRLAGRVEIVKRDGLTGLGRGAAAANFSPNTVKQQPELIGLYERLFELQDPDIYVRWCELLVRSSAAEVVPTISVPTLAVTGSHDQYAPPELVRAFMEQVPAGHELVVLEDCGHLPFLEAPDRFAAAVESFLASLC
jgi:pimeloyl-ACP methyl ester carboxylesterase